MDSISELYSNTARWVDYYGWIEIGQHGLSSSFVRALDEGGMVWEGKDDYKSLDEALRALDGVVVEFGQKTSILNHHNFS